jgi:hypothetical protein
MRDGGLHRRRLRVQHMRADMLRRPDDEKGGDREKSGFIEGQDRAQKSEGGCQEENRQEVSGAPAWASGTNSDRALI